MSKDLNKVMIIGRLGIEPEMRFTPQGTAVTTFRVASSRTWKDAGGATQEATEWFRVVVWNKLAEVCNDYLRKGSRVYIEGRVQTRKWAGEDGQERFTTEVIANDVIMLDGRKSDSSVALAEPDQEPEQAAPPLPATAPTPAPHQNPEPVKRKATSRRVAQRASSSTFESEDLPF